MPKTTTVTIRLTPQDVARLDEMRGSGVSRSAFVRDMLRRAGPMDNEPSYGEAVRLLAESARAGRVQAQIALERALRAARGGDTADGWLSELLGD